MACDTLNCLAFDFGAGSGRAVLMTLQDGRLTSRELLRFASVERLQPDGLHWDAAALMAQVEQGLRAAAATGEAISSVGVDTWGLDYGLLDGEGRLLGDPFHYRDARSQRGHAASPLADEALGRITQAQVLPVNTLFQLIDDVNARPAVLHGAARLLMMADLVNHHLTGLACNELTLARTSGLHAWSEGDWSAEILARAQIPRRLLGKIILPGTVLGQLRPEVAARCGIAEIPVIAVAGHDTASAVYALPLQSAEAFLIAGTWNLIGFETSLVPDAARSEGFGVEGGAEGRALVTRSLAGFLLIRRLKSGLSRLAGREIGFAEMSDLARQALQSGKAPPLETSDPNLLAAEDFVAASVEQIRSRGLAPLADNDALVLALYLGLAARICDGIARINRLTPVPVRCLRVGGGGSQDAFFCEVLAAQLNIPVVAGPVEASATGNGLFQLIGLGRVPSLAAARLLVETFATVRTYLPDAALQRLLVANAQL